MSRRLAAILVADVVGYSRLMEADEAGTLAALKARRKDIVEPLVKEHGGRVVKFMGDGVLVEFGSAVNAVTCALAMQERMAAANADVPEAKRILLRIGINLGDVVGEGSDIFGDGVNVAARLEALAEPGGVCISDKVHEEVTGKVSRSFIELGERPLKNMTRRVRAYRASGAVQHSESGKSTQTEIISIAVLPFNNMSGDLDQEYFADGLTEDLITELSRFKFLAVAARNSTFHFKNTSPMIQEVGRALGVRFVLEGSVRKFGNRVRITAQLIEAAGGTHLWAERFDRELSDIFAVQDEVVHTIAGIIPGQVGRAKVNEIRHKHPQNLTAYDCELRGRWALAHWAEGLVAAKDWFEKALEADPNYAMAHAGLAMAYAYGIYVIGIEPATALARGKGHAERALLLDPENPTVNAYAAFAFHVACEPERALAQSERAVRLNPNDSFSIYVRACALTYGGRPEEAIDWYERSAKLDPFAPDDQRLDTYCDCLHLLGQYEQALRIYEQYQQLPAFLYLPMAANYARLGRPEMAATAVETYQRVRPEGHDAAMMVDYQVRMLMRQADREYLRESYRLAGVVP